MYFTTQKKHHIDLIFILALFFLFAFSSIVLIILGADFYKNTNTQTELHFNERSISSYLTEKIRQNDISDSIVISSLQDIPSLTMTQTINGTNYTTYLYVYQNHLYELFARSDLDMSPDAGTEILPLERLSFSYANPHLLKLTYKEPSQNEQSVYIALHTSQN